jgi:hypothetical protein
MSRGPETRGPTLHFAYPLTKGISSWSPATTRSARKTGQNLLCSGPVPPRGAAQISAQFSRSLLVSLPACRFRLRKGKQEGTPSLEATGYRYGNLRQVTTIKLVLTCHEA